MHTYMHTYIKHTYIHAYIHTYIYTVVWNTKSISSGPIVNENILLENFLLMNFCQCTKISLLVHIQTDQYTDTHIHADTRYTNTHKHTQYTHNTHKHTQYTHKHNTLMHSCTLQTIVFIV